MNWFTKFSGLVQSHLNNKIRFFFSQVFFSMQLCNICGVCGKKKRSMTVLEPTVKDYVSKVDLRRGTWFLSHTIATFMFEHTLTLHTPFFSSHGNTHGNQSLTESFPQGNHPPVDILTNSTFAESNINVLLQLYLSSCPQLILWKHNNKLSFEALGQMFDRPWWQE